MRVAAGCDSCASILVWRLELKWRLLDERGGWLRLLCKYSWVEAGSEVAELDARGGWLRLYYASFALPTVGQQSVLVAHYCMARVFHCVQPAK